MHPKHLIHGLLLTASLALAHCSNLARTTAYLSETDLALRLSDARVLTEGPAPPEIARLEIDQDYRRTISLHPPAAIAFPDLPSGEGSRLQLAPAIDPKSWRQTDGVRFIATCTTDSGQQHRLLSVELSPRDRDEDREWRDQDVSLESCSRPTTTVRLRTKCGRYGSCRYDWAHWGHPRIVTRRTLQPKSRQIALLVSIDTLRPDRLEPYGGPHPNSSSIAGLASDGIVFETVIAPASSTPPSHATMLTSTEPLTHGYFGGDPIRKGIPALAKELQEAGWQTAAFVDVAWLRAESGLARGFDHYDDTPPPQGALRRGARATRDAMLEWLDTADERPAFLFWHIFDVHGPFTAAAPFAGTFRRQSPSEDSEGVVAKLKQLRYHDYQELDRFSSMDELLATYDEGIAEVDAVIGSALELLKAVKLYDDALIVITSDHGESFFDHGVWVGHGLFLTDAELHVPLIAKLPGNERRGSRSQDLAGLIDISPTVLDALDLPPESDFQGRTLLSAPSEEPAITAFSPVLAAGAVRTRALKYIEGSRNPKVREQIFRKHLRPEPGSTFRPRLRLGEQLYDVRRDPGETNNLRGTKRSEAMIAKLRALLPSEALNATEATGEDPESALTEEDRARLRALGYLN